MYAGIISQPRLPEDKSRSPDRADHSDADLLARQLPDRGAQAGYLAGLNRLEHCPVEARADRRTWRRVECRCPCLVGEEVLGGEGGHDREDVAPRVENNG